jgi:type IV pilus assembly protein PilC
MIFKYTAISENGNKVSGVIESESEEEVLESLRKSYKYILSVTKQKAVKKRKINKKDLVTFTDLLSISINAGLPIVKALEVSSKNISDKYLLNVISSIISSIRSGKFFSEALSMYSDVFDSMYVGIIKSGESSGKLGEALHNLSNYLQKSYEISSKVKSSLVYPTIVLGVAIGVLILFMVSIVPKFGEIYSSYSANLPKITEIVISMGNFTKNNLLLVILGLAVPAYLLKYFHDTSERFRLFLQDFVIKVLPPLGKYWIKTDVEKFARIMAIMLQNGVMITKALETSASVMSLIRLRDAILSTIFDLERGEQLSHSLSTEKLFPPLLIQMINVGEETGELPQTFEKLANFYSLDLDRESEIITSTLSPIMILFVGAIVGFLVLSLFMPMFTLQQILIR